MNYKFRHDGGDVIPCDSCGCEAPTGEFEWGPPYSKEHDTPMRLLCEFCSTTLTSRYTETAARDDFGALRAEIWTAAACVFNMIKKDQDETTTP